MKFGTAAYCLAQMREPFARHTVEDPRHARMIAKAIDDVDRKIAEDPNIHEFIYGEGTEEREAFEAAASAVPGGKRLFLQLDALSVMLQEAGAPAHVRNELTGEALPAYSYAKEFAAAPARAYYFVVPRLAEAFAHAKLPSDDGRQDHDAADPAPSPETVIRIFLPPGLIAFGGGHLVEVAGRIDRESHTLFLLETFERPGWGFRTNCNVLYLDSEEPPEAVIADIQTQRKSTSRSANELTDEPYRILQNALFYQSSNDPDILRQINPEYDALRARHLKAPRGSKKRAKLLEQMRDAGEHEHFLMGLKFETIQRRAVEPDREGGESSGQTDDPNTLSPKLRHWVREHWRWQPCGPQQSERRLTLVRAHERGSVEADVAYRMIP